MGDWSSSAPPPGAMLRRVFRPTPRRLRACRTRFWKRAVRTAGPSIPGGHETQGSSTPCRLPTGSKIKSKIISWHKPKPSTDPRGAAIRSCHRRREVYMRVSFLIGALIVAMLLRRPRTCKRARQRRVVCQDKYRRWPCPRQLRLQVGRGLSSLGHQRQSRVLHPKPCIQETTVV